MYNPQKDSFLFTGQERIDMFREALTDVGDRVRYDSFHGLLVDYVESMQASIIIRGLRAVSDFDYEFQMALMNRRMKPGIETIFLMTSAAHFYTASRLVKEIASLDGAVDGLLDEDGDVTRGYGVRALPATFLVDRQGVLRLQRLGPLVDGGPNTTWSRDWLADQVRALLAAG